LLNVLVGSFKVLYGFTRLFTRATTPWLGFTPIRPKVKEYNRGLSAREKSELIGILFFGAPVLGASLQEPVSCATVSECELITAGDGITIRTAGTLLGSIGLSFALRLTAPAYVTIDIERFMREHVF